MLTKKYKSSEYKNVINDLLSGEVVGFPTETVYGLAIVYDNKDSFKKLAQAKKRDINKPISMMVYEGYNLNEIAYVDERAKKIINHFMPGAITVILKAKDTLPEHVTLGHKTIGIRIPTNETALNILKEVKKPLLVTSANIAGKDALMKANDVYREFDGVIASLILEDAINGVASTVVDLSGEEIKILREGPITLNEINETLKGE